MTSAAALAPSEQQELSQRFSAFKNVFFSPMNNPGREFLERILDPGFAAEGEDVFT